MNRRAFLATLGVASIVLTLPAAAQPADRTRRLGVMVLGVEDAQGRSLVAIFRERLEQLGWAIDRDLQIDVRCAGADTRRAAAELVRSAPDVIFVQGTAGIEAVLQETRTIPTVFVQVTDPIAAGLVSGGNVTGVANFPPSIAGDRVRVLKEIAPQVARVLLVHDRNYATPRGLLLAAEAAAKSLGIELVGSGVADVDELEVQVRWPMRIGSLGGRATITRWRGYRSLLPVIRRLVQ
jgi:putative ABC transport system substrate-binding protein